MTRRYLNLRRDETMEWLEVVGLGLGILAMISMFVGAFLAYLTHLYWIIWLLMGDTAAPLGKVTIAFLGMIFPPFGALHGGYLWFNPW